jgi:hypothetical protein
VNTSDTSEPDSNHAEQLSIRWLSCYIHYRDHVLTHIDRCCLLCCLEVLYPKPLSSGAFALSSRFAGSTRCTGHLYMHFSRCFKRLDQLAKLATSYLCRLVAHPWHAIPVTEAMRRRASRACEASACMRRTPMGPTGRSKPRQVICNSLGSRLDRGRRRIGAYDASSQGQPSSVSRVRSWTLAARGSRGGCGYTAYRRHGGSPPRGVAKARQ